MRSKIFPSCFGLFFLCVIWISNAVAEPFRYEGVCEASAAAALNNELFAVASDETDLLTIYRRGHAAPVATFQLPEVTDIEAAARIGNTIFWLTSHSLNRDGEDKKKRKMLFATAVAADGSLANVGTIFRDLRAEVASKLGQSEHDLEATLDIEGLAATPGGDLLVGLRGPLDSDNRALVVKIENPFSLVGLPTPPTNLVGPSTSPISRLHLDQRGIRSIEFIGNGNNAYLLSAGPVSDGDLPPLLFFWDGLGDVKPGPKISLGQIKPEAIIHWNEHTVQVLGDNDDNCSDESPKPRWFPSIEFSLISGRD